MTRKAQAEALFGSTSRGDSDDLSDTDFLIVDSDIDVLKSRGLELEAQGCSVASYTWRKLIGLSKSKALFLQHLKLESQILRDERNQLASILDLYKPKLNYDDEILQNSHMASIATTFPASSRGVLWASDVLYVCLRNFGVLFLANKQRYTFAFNAILNDLVRHRCITGNEAAAINKLRWMKSLYRNGHKLPYAKALNILQEAAASMPQRVLSERCRASNPNDILTSARSLPLNASPYHRLRSLEKLYVALMEVKHDCRHYPKLELLKRWIADPRNYATFASANEQVLVEAILACNCERDGRLTNLATAV